MFSRTGTRWRDNWQTCGWTDSALGCRQIDLCCLCFVGVGGCSRRENKQKEKTNPAPMRTIKYTRNDHDWHARGYHRPACWSPATISCMWPREKNNQKKAECKWWFLPHPKLKSYSSWFEILFTAVKRHLSKVHCLKSPFVFLVYLNISTFI